ncbi:MAG: CDP-diacylglycerol--glycerol-3-phosphate 3-phosphatidyltransferase [Ruminococcaceae bacterium]|nr:CDP-diacylglycerol--glycerol-3-phosphate 3-phosphatidyltransferase [Oscillospiraceae bacterium]
MSLLKKSAIPNILTLFRMLLVPVFIYFFHVTKQHVLAVAVFLLAGFTDVLDGFLARHYNWTSNIGKILDPFADKCMQVTALVCLGQSGFVPWWVVGVLVLKELVLFIGALFALKKEKVYVQSNWYGKAGTVAFYIVATLLVLVKDMSDTLRITLGVFLILFMLFALIMYVDNYRKNIMNTFEKKEDMSDTERG